ncbi:FKB42 [Auxenochlorella protothecoides x Auxenochlorella symbiontica]|uniref:peptidylprolyl isomerase n=1 Tax=Auxenochlorella protothecoides TaxID=3075 RepID=A0A1D1ZUP9_AUXPR
MNTDPPSGPLEKHVITDDGGVVKFILREGRGTCPPKHARCLVHYVGRLVEGDAVFMDTRSEGQGEPVKLVAGRVNTARETGLNLAVATMVPGELARIEVAPRYGFGVAGSFSFPTVPPHAGLVYELELLDYEEVDEDARVGSMLFEDRLEAAERRRAEGNALFKAGDGEMALRRYHLALSYLDADLLMQLEGRHLDAAQAIRAPTLSNVAAVLLSQRDWAAAAAAAGEALAMGVEAARPKLLYRRGLARRALGQTDAAVEDLHEAARLAPGDGLVRRELAEAKREQREERASGARLFGGVLGRPQAPVGLAPPSQCRPAHPAAAPTPHLLQAAWAWVLACWLGLWALCVRWAARYTRKRHAV